MLTPLRVREGLVSTVTAVASGSLGDETTITVSASPAHADTRTDDYGLSANKVLKIAAGETRSTGTVTIKPVDDELNAGRTREVRVSGTVTGGGGVANPADRTLTILEDDVGLLIELIATPAMIAEGEASTITMRALQPARADVAVTVEVASGADAVELSENPVLTIADGETESTGVVTLTALDDVDTSNEVVQLRGNPSPDNQQLVGVKVTKVQLIDNDATSPLVVFTPVPDSVFEGGTSTIIADLSQPLSHEVTVTIAIDEAHRDHTVADDEYTVSANRTLTISAGARRSTGVVTLTASNDEYYGPLSLRRVVLGIASVTGIDENKVNKLADWHIREDEAQPRMTLEVTPASVSENGGQTTVTAKLNTKVDGDVKVTISTDPVGTARPEDFTQTGTQLTITAGEKTSTATVTIDAVDDSLDGADKHFVVTGTVEVVEMEESGIVWHPFAESLTIRDDDVVPGTPVVTVNRLDGKLELSWPKPAEGTSSITGYDYRYKTTAGAESTWSAWADTGLSGSGSTLVFEITSLTNGTDYTVEVRAKSAAGFSLAGSANGTPTAPPPMITSVAITSGPGTDKTYAIGDDIEFTLTFDKDLTLGGSDTSRTPGFVTYQTDYAADTAGVDHPEAGCAIGTNTKTLVCTDTVNEGWYDTDGIAVNANAFSDLFSITYVAGPLGQRVNRDHSALPVDANHKIDGVKPTLTTTGVSSDDTKIILTFSENIGTVDRTKITLESGGTAVTATADSINEATVEITLTTALTAADTMVTVELDADAVTDVPGNGNDAVSSMAVSLVDNTGPTLTGAGTTSTTEILLSFDEALDSGSIPDKSQFAVTVGGASRTVSSVAMSGTMGISLTLSSAFGHGDTLTVTYNVPSTNPIRDVAENNAAAFTTGTGGVAAVINNVPPPPAVISTIALTSTPGNDETYAIRRRRRGDGDLRLVGRHHRHPAAGARL